MIRVELVTVSLATFYFLSCAYFCKALALLQISRFAFQKKVAERNSLTCQTYILWRGEAEERSNTGVLQVMRQEKTKKYYLSGVTGSTLVTLRHYL